MMTDLPILDALEADTPVPEKIRCLGTIGRLLSYPDNHYLQLVELLYVIVQTKLPEAAKEVSAFGQFVDRCSEFELEEAYTRTFDVNPACALEIGWHLFGEDYTRGQFLVRIRGELAKYEIPESSELPDHLTHVLAVVASMPDDEAHYFSHACVFPALHKMQASLDKNQSPYRHLIRCLTLVLEDLYGKSEAWDEEESVNSPNERELVGRNGHRPPGLSDPLRSYSISPAPCDAAVEIVPLQMQFGASRNQSTDIVMASNGRVK